MLRRQFIKLASATAGLAQATSRLDLEYNGVTVGIQSFCFYDQPFEAMLDAVVAVGVGGLELFSGHAEPPHLGRAERRQWRLVVDLGHFRAIRDRVAQRGVTLISYDISMRADWTDQEIERAFQMAQALGVSQITTSSNVSVAERLDAVASGYKIRVGLHNHGERKADEFATADDYARALKGRSDWLGITLDVGHFGAAGFDPLPFLQQQRKRIFAVHFKDRRKDLGPQVQFGEGDSHLAEILDYIEREHWSVPLLIEHVLKDADRVPAIRKDFEWMKARLNN